MIQLQVFAELFTNPSNIFFFSFSEEPAEQITQNDLQTVMKNYYTDESKLSLFISKLQTSVSLETSNKHTYFHISRSEGNLLGQIQPERSGTGDQQLEPKEIPEKNGCLLLEASN